jgi:hypothetical protein
MITLRDLLWVYLFGKEPPIALAGKEILTSFLIALFLIALYWVFQKIIFFGINDDARHSRAGAWVFAGSLSLGWLVASLDLLGLWSSIAALVLVAFAIFADLVYLLVTRS